MFSYKDQLGNTVTLDKKPLRIISLVPSQSELLWDLGLRNELCGITKFCIHPSQMYNTITRVGGTKNLKLDTIRKLKPDLIIGNKEENEKGQIEILQQEFKVWMSDIYDFDDAFEMIKSLGEITDKNSEAEDLVLKLKDSLLNIKDIFPKKRLAYFIWNKPYMFAANNTFINYVLHYIGFQNAFEKENRYPQLDDTALKRLDPEICFLSSEPFPFKEKHVKQLQQRLPRSKIFIVDGEVFSWYGSRLLHLEKYVNDLRNRI